eukprot:GEMP01024754.1.p1 GENE.GEMP01024754.1~~GEMP01024754.1.p1  ORF type:complete len:563 (+),score=80.44 GEMP01024754.1:199-1887(+)
MRSRAGTGSGGRIRLVFRAPRSATAPVWTTPASDRGCRNFNFLCEVQHVQVDCQGPAKYTCPAKCNNCSPCFSVPNCLAHTACGFCGICHGGFYATPEGVCSPCSLVVLNCDHHATCGVCRNCTNGYQVTPAGTCSPCNLVDYCYVHVECGVCKTCVDGYHVDSNGACSLGDATSTIPNAPMVGLAAISRLKMTDLLETTCQNGGTYKENNSGISRECSSKNMILCDQLVTMDAVNNCADNGFVQQCCRQSCGLCVPVPWRILPMGTTVCWTYTRDVKLLQEMSCNDEVDVRRLRCCDSTTCESFNRDDDLMSPRELTSKFNYFEAFVFCKLKGKKLCTLHQAVQDCTETEHDKEPILLQNPAAVECHWLTCVAADEWCPIGEYEARTEGNIEGQTCQLSRRMKLCCREPDDARIVVKWVDIDALIGRFPAAMSADGMWDVFDFSGSWTDTDILILFELADRDRDGLLTREELRVFTAKHISFLREVTLQRLRFHFNRMDWNKDGLISWAETGLAQRDFMLKNVKTAWLVDRWDTSGDNLVSWNEFLYGLGITPPGTWMKSS